MGRLINDIKSSFENPSQDKIQNAVMETNISADGDHTIYMISRFTNKFYDIHSSILKCKMSALR